MNIRSSHVQTIAYDGNTITVKFKHSPNLYTYLGVPPLLQRGLAAAKSKGTFLHKYIIPYKKVLVEKPEGEK